MLQQVRRRIQTCETYAVSFKLLLEYAATRTRTRPSRLSIEQLDAPLIVDFLAHIERERRNGEYVLDEYIRVAAKTCPTLARRMVSPHRHRRSCAAIMLQATHDIRKVALWLGHADIRTTEVYLRMDASEKLEAVEAIVPPELRCGRFKARGALIASLTAKAVP